MHTIFRTVALFCALFLGHTTAVMATDTTYEQARELGRTSVQEAQTLLNENLREGVVIALTNAGYAMPGGGSSKGCLDGIADAANASVGASTLIAVQSRMDAPLWFAFYRPESGECAYLEGNATHMAQALEQGEVPTFSRRDTMRIDAEHLFAHPETCSTRIKEGAMGSNAFRVITIANAAAKNCPDHALQAMVVHDHFCPGVSSGIILASYIQHHLLRQHDTKLFLLSLTPWCKEDALTTLLNATPGKGAYGVLYGDRKNTDAWPAALRKTCTIAFVQNADKTWTGHLLGFDFERVQQNYADKTFGSPLLDKLYADLWFLDHMNNPEAFVETFGQIQLPRNTSPKTFLQPTPDILEALVPRS